MVQIIKISCSDNTCCYCVALWYARVPKKMQFASIAHEPHSSSWDANYPLRAGWPKWQLWRRLRRKFCFSTTEQQLQESKQHKTGSCKTTAKKRLEHFCWSDWRHQNKTAEFLQRCSDRFLAVKSVFRPNQNFQLGEDDLLVSELRLDSARFLAPSLGATTFPQRLPSPSATSLRCISLAGAIILPQNVV